MKIALAGRNDTSQIVPFCKAEFFRIFALQHGSFQLTEIRAAEFESGAHGNHLEDLSRWVLKIADCAGIIASDIGPTTQELLTSRHIYPLVQQGEGRAGIDLALAAIYSRLKFKQRFATTEYSI